MSSQNVPVSFAQTRYWESDVSLSTARAVIRSKCKNMAALIRLYLPYRLQSAPKISHTLSRSTHDIFSASRRIQAVSTRQELMLIEAQATKSYWKAFAILVKALRGWSRIYPHATDPWNAALNVGYTMLTNLIRTSIVNAGLDPGIGCLHTPRVQKEALVYDLMELFRQPMVDAAIIPLFSRRKRVDSITTKNIIHALLRRWEKEYSYHGTRIPLKDICIFEIREYKKAVINNVAWRTTVHFGTHTKSKKP